MSNLSIAHCSGGVGDDDDDGAFVVVTALSFLVCHRHVYKVPTNFWFKLG